MIKNVNWQAIAKVFLVSTSLIALLSVIVVTFLSGYRYGIFVTSNEYETYINELANKNIEIIDLRPTNPPAPQQVNKPSQPAITWGGPQLWTAVNAKRVTYGVNSLSQKDVLCTIASIRLNELLALGKLDGHEGFSNLAERRPDLKYIFEKYVIAEFLVSGADTPEEAVSLWDNTLGHKKLLTGGEYVYGCIYAQNGFGVAIAAYE